MANWYAYNGVGDPNVPGSYYKMAVNPNCLTGGSIICAIYLDDTATVPSSIAAVLTYIANAEATLVPQPAGISDRRFVYVKNLTS